MIFYHTSTLPLLPTQLLLTVHMRLCGIRSREWGSPSPRAWYYAIPYTSMFTYHYEVICEMRSRGFNPCPEWSDITYMGREKGYQSTWRVPASPVSDYESKLPTSNEDEIAAVSEWRRTHGY